MDEAGVYMYIRAVKPAHLKFKRSRVKCKLAPRCVHLSSNSICVCLFYCVPSSSI